MQNAADQDADQAANNFTVTESMDVDAEPAKERVTTPYMTKYERARVLGTRALQIRYV